jgi:hypothetical protein
VYNAAVEPVSSEFFVFPLLIIISSLLHSRLPLPDKLCDCPDQAAHYCTFRPKLGASFLTRYIILGLGVKVIYFVSVKFRIIFIALK